MTDNLDVIYAADQGIALKPFIPSARYYAAMDFVIYLNEDCSYRADRIDPFLTLLWHPYDDRAVGIKLKGFGYLYERLSAIMSAQGIEIGNFLSLVSLLEVALTAGGDAMTADAQQERMKDGYTKARGLIAEVQAPAAAFAQAA